MGNYILLSNVSDQCIRPMYPNAANKNWGVKENVVKQSLMAGEEYHPRPRNTEFYSELDKKGPAVAATMEWNNGTSFYYTPGINGTCYVIDFGPLFSSSNFVNEKLFSNLEFLFHAF
ncbi:hypothetical protein V6N11_070971 [Hibiscus sabdariffa]|uniref:Uncharacterized protein n=2 Tax=Hibiscus sabdariffa TaxID=183260 RepID=A0ABR1ZDN2_9ROSI